MKKDVYELVQHESKMYLLIDDPRKLIEYVKVPKPGEVQEAQRPWDDKRVKEIAKYVAGKLNISFGVKKFAIGLLPNTPVLILTEKELLKTDDQGHFYIEFPEDSSQKIFNILDGQHRLFSFLPEYIDPDFKSDSKYQMSFMVFSDLTTEQILELFTLINDTQKRVETNVLVFFRKFLGLLAKIDEDIFKIVEQLNKENISLLKGRIIISGEKVKNGLKMVQVSKIIKKSGAYDNLLTIADTADIRLKILCNYLSAWNNVYDNKLKDTKHTLSKISGLRYIMQFFPAFVDILYKKKVLATIPEIEKIVQVHKTLTNGDELFTGSNGLMFNSESSTVSLANNLIPDLKRHCIQESESFNPFS